MYVEGGSESIRFGVNLRYNNQNGVMKGSYRDRLGVGLTLDYFHKGFQIRNQVTYDQNRTKASPYGSFSDYTCRHPYDEWYDDKGEYVKTLPLWGLTGNYEKNPLYEASLENYSKTGSKEWVDNLTLNWFLNDYMLVKGQVCRELQGE